MKNNGFVWTCSWSFRQLRNHKEVWKYEKTNLLSREGGKAITATFLRNEGSTYFPVTNFYVGLYAGTVSKSTVLSSIPGEPSGYGYTRQEVERSAVGWPTFELDDSGDWRATSKELTLVATGGSIGPIDGAFLGTSSDSTGTLIGMVATDVRRTILSGDTLIIQLKAKIS